MTPTQGQSKRFAGLDAIRFVCAYMVVSGHSPSSLTFLAPLGRVPELIGKILRDIVNGPAAVIVFFVISGFCIHLPYRAGQPIGLDYFIRRYLRIGIPLVAALLVSPFFGIPATDLIESVLWSLFCELVYYSVYPLLLYVAKRVGWFRLTASAFVVAFVAALAWANPSGNYSSGKVFESCVIGLPCWLMGCFLAEREQVRKPSAGNIWFWRGGAFVASVITLELRFHTALHFDLSLNFFAIFVFYWLWHELEHGQTNPPWRWLERAGAWSYSLYVMHPAASRLPTTLFPGWSPAAQWLLRLPLTLGVCYVFYAVVEKPSHRLARAAANALRRPAATRLPAA